MLVWLLIVAAVLAFLWRRRIQRPADFPPGPPTFLIFGNLFETIKLVRCSCVKQMLQQRREKYGDINGIVTISGNFIVNIHKYDDIREICNMREFSGRPDSPLLHIRSYMKRMGLVFGDGNVWVEQRRFTLRHLRDLGFGKSTMEEGILDEFEFLRQDMENNPKMMMLVNDRFNLTALNIIWRIVASTRLDLSNPESHKHVRSVNEFFDNISPQKPIGTFPWLRYVMPAASGYTALVEQRDTFLKMFHDLVLQHRETLDPLAPRDYMDHVLLEMRKHDAEERGFTELGMAIACMDLFIAGMETTATSLNWAVLFMVTHPDVQRRVQAEVDAQLAGGRRVTSSNRLDMPYTDATLLEVMRRAPAVWRAVPHSAVTDFYFRGYRIPRGSVVMLNLESVLMDAGYWGDPEAFRPERFIASDGSVRRDPRLIPFGVGRRSCLGESLARMELFILFVSLMKRFTFLPIPGKQYSLDPEYGSLLTPKPFLVAYKVRE